VLTVRLNIVGKNY